MTYIRPDGDGPEWRRSVAMVLNMLQDGFEELDAPPAEKRPGATYFDKTDNKLKTWDGTAWQAHW